MESLIRTESGPFCIADSLTLSEIERLEKEDRLESRVLPIDEMFGELRAATLKESWERSAYNGNPLPLKAFQEEAAFQDLERARVYDSREDFIGIYEFREEKKGFVTVKMFYTGKKD